MFLKNARMVEVLFGPDGNQYQKKATPQKNFTTRARIPSLRSAKKIELVGIVNPVTYVTLLAGFIVLKLLFETSQGYHFYH